MGSRLRKAMRPPRPGARLCQVVLNLWGHIAHPRHFEGRFTETTSKPNARDA